MADQAPQNDDLAAFGEELRREREIRGISLKEIADATKISRRFLEAIERNDHKTLPAPVFTRGFVREYARYLGLNAEELVGRYNVAAAGDDRIEKTPHLDRLVPERATDERKPPPAPRGIPTPLARIDRGVYVLFLIALALGFAIYWTIKHRHSLMPSLDTAEAQHETTTAHTAVAPPVAPPVTASAAPPAVNDGTLRLSMTFVASSWMLIEVDHQTMELDAGKGDKKSFEAKDHILLKTVGNAGGVEMSLNDVPLPSLGPKGKVRHNILLDRDYLQKARAATTSTQP